MVPVSEFAFRQAPPDREIVSCRACVRAVWLPSRIPDQIPGLVAFPFPFYRAGLSLFPFVIGFPFSLVHYSVDFPLINMKSV